MGTISNHIRLALRVYRYNKLDQISLQVKVEEWQKDNPHSSFFIRSQSVGDDGKENDFLYVHQEQWQKDLIKKYGREITF